MAADWQEIGRRVRDQIINAKRRTGMADELIAIGQRPEYAFYRVLSQHHMGNSAPLIEYLRSYPPFSPADYKLLILHFSGVLSPTSKPGPSRDQNVRSASGLAQRVYRQWKSENAREGIKDWGLGNKMKEQSCHYAIEILKPLIEGEPPAFEAVLAMMGRSKRRQVLELDPGVTFGARV